MTDYGVQFDEKSVLEKFKGIRTLGRKSKIDTLFVIEHELRGDINAATLGVWYFNGEERGDFGELPTIHQRAYVQNLGSTGRLVLATLEDLVALCVKKDKPEEIEKGMKKSSRDLVHRLRTLSLYLPATENVLQLGNVSEERQRFLEEIDILYGLAFYTHNLKFARNFQRDVYNLKEDVEAFWSSQFSQRRTKTSLHFHKPQLETIETRVDYFGNVVLPLIKNIQQHTLNPDNDVYGRLRDPNFNRYFTITSKVDKENTEMIITVRDNGFGIIPDVQSRLFESGVTTKTDSEMKHGIGLWAVKEFVEINGGRIWSETELGKGTSFHFTIPYRSKDHIIYRA
ncbi:sensor histidine kinase [Candidatus Woesearchaeota archaeon]|nr:sensor histidine kinase [Candidatus Woesearchaeota archaeon]